MISLIMNVSNASISELVTRTKMILTDMIQRCQKFEVG